MCATTHESFAGSSSGISYFKEKNLINYMGKFELSLENGQHRLLSRLEGKWQGTATTWFEPGDPVDVSTIEGIIRPVLDGRFMMHEYESSFQGKPLTGISTFGYDLQKNQWQSTLMDTFHMSTGIMLLEGRGTNEMIFLGSYESQEPVPQKWGWRVEITLPDDDHLLLTSFNITPDGQATKAVEIKYQRKR
jgi:hypothetical protein